MERRKKIEPVTFVKRGGGSFVFKGKMIKQNQTFDAFPDELPKDFLDVIVPATPKDAEKMATSHSPVVEVTAMEYFLKSRGGGWYNVVSKDGKVQNEKALKREEAEKLVKSLQK